MQVAYKEAISETKRDSSRLISYLPNAPKVYLCSSLSNIEGKFVVFKLQLGETKDFVILSTKTPFSRAIAISYASKYNVLRMYGRKAYMKPIHVCDSEKEARDIAKELRDMLEKTCEPHFKRLSW